VVIGVSLAYAIAGPHDRPDFRSMKRFQLPPFLIAELISAASEFSSDVFPARRAAGPATYRALSAGIMKALQYHAHESCRERADGRSPLCVEQDALLFSPVSAWSSHHRYFFPWFPFSSALRRRERLFVRLWFPVNLFIFRFDPGTILEGLLPMNARASRSRSRQPRPLRNSVPRCALSTGERLSTLDR